MTYLFVKWLHLLGAAVLLGTGLGIAFFAWFGSRLALRDGNLGLLQGVLRLTVIADAVFTAPAAVLQPVTGLLLWHLSGGAWSSPWLLWALGLYALVGACWLPVVVLQIRLRDRALAVTGVQELGAAFHRAFRLWFILGWPAFAAVLALFALMLLRGAWA